MLGDFWASRFSICVLYLMLLIVAFTVGGVLYSLTCLLAFACLGWVFVMLSLRVFCCFGLIVLLCGFIFVLL